MSRVPFRYVAAGVGGLLVIFAAGSCVAEQKATPRQAAVASLAPDDVVTISVDKDARGNFTLQAQPRVGLRPQGTGVAWNFAWKVPKADRAYLEIEFLVSNGSKGPFPRDPNAPDNPVQGRYTNKTTGRDTIQAAPSQQPGDTSWKYEVVLRDSGDNDLAVVDPIIIFK